MSHSQQEVPKIHSLSKLFKLCDNDLENKNFDLVSILDSLYIESRYPGDMGLLPYGNPTIEDAKEFYEFALSFFQEVCEKLNVDSETLVRHNGS